MHMYWIFYDVAYDEDVMEMLEHCCITGFTKWDRVLGKGPHAEPKMDNAVWPGFNCAVAVIAETPVAEELLRALRELKERMGRRGIEVFRTPVERID
ncbi:nitrogen regulatory protein P-II family [Desulfacinum hydrothermale DSM 13146]|uniref:Nitrogen regulatory protein P-II family n=1 Tax=Desulfacinum hydrothermale DSM 13146 TaxID=1121390 RepID=A0A1W1X8U7_9BACT|nr:PG0541 family transporter-associated protein [Desulfacinum hydrothermale]SMC20260.1 nitrogen regulatory protein P-II family [Desulfacinum hydrothermale DSM 13146]